MQLTIKQTWSCTPVNSSDFVEVLIDIYSNKPSIKTNAPYYGDPAPNTPPGLTDKLWEYEVVEVFLVGEDNRYLEIEMGPHGHYLVLELDGIRNIIAKKEINYQANILDKHWQGIAEIPKEFIPKGLNKINAFAIHGTGENRSYLAWHALPGETVDFHQPHYFPALK